MIFSLSCSDQEKIPKELKLSFDYLDKHWDSKEIETFKNISKNDSIKPKDYHIANAMKIRINEHSENLTNFFDSIGVHHDSDMSSIILTSYHRYLNKENIELQCQVDEYVEYWKPIIECKKKQKIKADKIYNKSMIGDAIKIKMLVNKNSGVVDYPCSNGNLECEFDESRDVAINGIIIYKYNYNIDNEENMFFKIKVLSKNQPDTEIIMREVNVGEEFDFELSSACEIETTGNNGYNSLRP